ncbi:hypothetical protein TNCV_3830521 [Trichonephila clavipes]|nr:hypothetical protein TNCV_3830521 [Trichonephila clavipes]
MERMGRGRREEELMADSDYTEENLSRVDKMTKKKVSNDPVTTFVERIKYGGNNENRHLQSNKKQKVETLQNWSKKHVKIGWSRQIWKWNQELVANARWDLKIGNRSPHNPNQDNRTKILNYSFAIGPGQMPRNVLEIGYTKCNKLKLNSAILVTLKRTEPNRTVTYMVLKATANDRTKTSPLPR